MALATYHSDRGESSALIMVKANKFEFSSKPAYIPREALAGLKPGDTFEIPDGFRFVEKIDYKTGKPQTTSDGAPLHILVW